MTCALNWKPKVQERMRRRIRFMVSVGPYNMSH